MARPRRSAPIGSPITDEERFLFDLHGYLLLRGVLSADEVTELCALADQRFPDRDPAQTNRMDDVNQWGPATARLIDHARVLPDLIEFLGPELRLDLDYCIFMHAGNTRLGLHGGQEMGESQYYRYLDGEIRTGISTVVFSLSHVAAGDGGFSCIPGSHKSNFEPIMPEDVRYFKRQPDYLVQPVVEAGDALIFTESLIHGTLPWRARHERKALLYKYSPGHMSWSIRSYDPADYGELTEQ